MEMLGGKEALAQCRKPEIMADAAYAILTRDSRSKTGEFLIDENVLQDVGVTNFDSYAHDPGTYSVFIYYLIERRNSLHKQPLCSHSSAIMVNIIFAEL